MSATGQATMAKCQECGGMLRAEASLILQLADDCRWDALGTGTDELVITCDDCGQEVAADAGPYVTAREAISQMDQMIGRGALDLQ